MISPNIGQYGIEIGVNVRMLTNVRLAIEKVRCATYIVLPKMAEMKGFGGEDAFWLATEDVGPDGVTILVMNVPILIFALKAPLNIQFHAASEIERIRK